MRLWFSCSAEPFYQFKPDCFSCEAVLWPFSCRVFILAGDSDQAMAFLRLGIFVQTLLSLCHLLSASHRNFTCKEKRIGNAVMYDCSEMGLTQVPNDIPANVSHLNLDDNLIHKLPKDAFVRAFSSLLVLTLRNNLMETIDEGAFDNLPQLQDLNLFGNCLTSNFSLSESVFSKLASSLKKLDLRKNCPCNQTLQGCVYPKSVAKLTRLTELKMDLLRDVVITEDFSSLVALNSLTFGGGTKLKYVGDLFTSFRLLNVTEVNLSGLDIGRIHNDTFYAFPNLVKLVLSDNPRLGSNVAEISDSLHNTSIQTLILDNIRLEYQDWTASDTLRRFCGLNLKMLSINQNKNQQNGSNLS